LLSEMVMIYLKSGGCFMRANRQLPQPSVFVPRTSPQRAGDRSVLSVWAIGGYVVV